MGGRVPKMDEQDAAIQAGDDEIENEMEISTAGGAVPARLEETVRAAREYAEAARAPNTVRAYDSYVEDFSTYCRVELGGASAL